MYIISILRKYFAVSLEKITVIEPGNYFWVESSRNCKKTKQNVDMNNCFLKNKRKKNISLIDSNVTLKFAYFVSEK